jgi:tetratricopeptide (TPR) repeat protein
MKTIWIFSIALFPLILLAQSQDPHHIESSEKQYIEWFGEDETANAFVEAGIWHLMNAENEKAVTFFMEALDRDSNLFASHVALAWLTWGNTRDMHVAAAKDKVKGKNEVSQLFVSLLDLDNPKEGDAYLVWKKMHELSEGKLIHFYYARSIPDHHACIEELEYLLKVSMNEENTWNAHIYNALGYFYYRDNKMDKAKEQFEKYMDVYPEGYNPYDSMGEFYLNSGNKEKAVEYFSKSVEHFPGAVNAIQMLNKIDLETAEH